MNIIGVSIDIIPLTSLAELKKPKYPFFAISYESYPRCNKSGINISNKYNIKVLNKVILLILNSSLIGNNVNKSTGKKNIFVAD